MNRSKRRKKKSRNRQPANAWAGRHNVTLDTRLLTPGPYVVRVTDDMGYAVSTLVVRI